MQTLNIDGTTYTLKFDKDPIAWAKAARKPWKPAKPKDLRKFPTWTPDMSTARYVQQYDLMNYRVPVEYFPRLNVIDTAQYDPTIPLMEILTDENAY
jgi:hypothetical protein